MKHKTTAEIIDVILKNFEKTNVINGGNLYMGEIVISLDGFYEIENLLIKNNIIIKVDGYKWEITPVGKKVKRMGYEKWILKQEKIKDTPIWYNRWFIIFSLMMIVVALYKEQILSFIDNIIQKIS